MFTRGFYGLALMAGQMGEPAHAGLCRNCGKCVKACPQHIAIPEELKNVNKTLGGLRTKLILIPARFLFNSNVKDE